MSLNRLTTWTARYTSPDEVEGTSIWTFENYPRNLIWLESTDKKQAWTDHSKVWYNLNVSPYYGKTRVLRRKIVKWISIVSLREGVMPRMFAVWSVAFYRCFQCNCYARRGDLSSKVTLGLLSLLVPGYLGGFQFSEMCAIRKSPPYICFFSCKNSGNYWQVKHAN